MNSWFTIDRYSHGCSGVPYKSKLCAIRGDSWSVWTDKRVRSMFNNGQGTMEDFRRYCKNNNCTAVLEDDFWKIAKPLGVEWRHGAERFINETIEKCKW